MFNLFFRNFRLLIYRPVHHGHGVCKIQYCAYNYTVSVWYGPTLACCRCRFILYILYIKREVNNFLTLSRAAQNWIPHCTRKAQSPTPRCPGQRCMFLSIFNKEICFTLSKIFFMRDQYIGTWHPQASQISSHSSFMTFVYDNKNNEFVWWYPG